MTLSSEQVELLKNPLDLEGGHSVRVGAATEDKKRAQWLVYTEEEPVIERLNEVDPNWSMEIFNTTQSAKEFSVFMRLTVCGITRDGVGTDKNEKAAATDALKRVARLFGIGLYLKRAPRIWTEWKEKPTWAEQEKWEAEALRKFQVWYRQQFGGEQKSIPSQSELAPEASTDPTPKTWINPASVRAMVNWAHQYFIDNGVETKNTPHTVNRIAVALGLPETVRGSMDKLAEIMLEHFTGTKGDAWKAIQIYAADKADEKAAEAVEAG